MEPSFVPTIVDRMICVPDAASLAAMRELERATGRRAGGSTGTNLWGAFQLVAEMLAAGRTGSVVTLLCDGGERYAHTYYSDDWVAGQGLDLAPHAATLRRFAATGEWAPCRLSGRDGRHRPSRCAAALPASNLHDRSQAGSRARVLKRVLR